MRSPSENVPSVRTSLAPCEKSDHGKWHDPLAVEALPLALPRQCRPWCTPSSHCRLRYHAVDCYRITLTSSSARGTRHFVSAETERASWNRRAAPKIAGTAAVDARMPKAQTRPPAVALTAARSRSGDLETAAPAERWRVDVAVEPALCNLFVRTLRPSRSAAGCERSHSARRCLPASARACRAGLAHGDWICPTSKQNESVLVREMSVNDGQS